MIYSRCLPNINTFFKVNNVAIFLIKQFFDYDKNVDFFNIFFFSFLFSSFFFVLLSKLISIEKTAKTLSLILFFDDCFEIMSFKIEINFRFFKLNFIFFLWVLVVIVCENAIFSKNFLIRLNILIISRRRREATAIQRLWKPQKTMTTAVYTKSFN